MRMKAPWSSRRAAADRSVSACICECGYFCEYGGEYEAMYISSLLLRSSPSISVGEGERERGKSEGEVEKKTAKSPSGEGDPAAKDSRSARNRRRSVSLYARVPQRAGARSRGTRGGPAATTLRGQADVRGALVPPRLGHRGSKERWPGQSVARDCCAYMQEAI